jgi:hypothetical protein
MWRIITLSSHWRVHGKARSATKPNPATAPITVGPSDWHARHRQINIEVEHTREAPLGVEQMQRRVVLKVSASIGNDGDAERGQERRQLTCVMHPSETPVGPVRLISRRVNAQVFRCIARVEADRHEPQSRNSAARARPLGAVEPLKARAQSRA